MFWGYVYDPFQCLYDESCSSLQRCPLLYWDNQVPLSKHFSLAIGLIEPPEIRKIIIGSGFLSIVCFRFLVFPSDTLSTTSHPGLGHNIAMDIDFNLDPLVSEKMQPTSVMAQILMHWDEVITLLERLSQRSVSRREVSFKGVFAGSHDKQ